MIMCAMNARVLMRIFNTCICELTHFRKSNDQMGWKEGNKCVFRFSYHSLLFRKNHLLATKFLSFDARTASIFFSFSSKFRLLGVMTNISLKEHTHIQIHTCSRKRLCLQNHVRFDLMVPIFRLGNMNTESEWNSVHRSFSHTLSPTECERDWKIIPVAFLLCIDSAYTKTK